MKKTVLLLAIITMSFTARAEFDWWGWFDTDLEVYVVDINGNPVGGAKLTLYKSKEDYVKEENAIGEAEYTNKEGIGLFTKLEPTVYYIVARKDKKDNSGKSPIISKLSEGDTNKITVVIQ